MRKVGGTAAGGVAGAVIGGAVGGPVGAVVGAVVGAAAGGLTGSAFDYNEAEPEFRSEWERSSYRDTGHLGTGQPGLSLRLRELQQAGVPGPPVGRGPRAT